MLPVDQFDRDMRPAGRGLHLDPIAQQLIGAQVGRVEGDAGGVGGGEELLQGGGNLGCAIAAALEVGGQQLRLDRPVMRPRVPVAQVTIAEAAACRGCGEERDHAVLRQPFGARSVRHRVLLK